MLDDLNAYLEKDIYPFHMPGHKRNSGFLSLGREPAFFDVTEFEGMDNLHSPAGMILDSQKRCAALFGAEESFYLVNGSTGGIIAAILSCCQEGEAIAVARNSHKSVFSGVAYSGARPYYVYPSMTKWGIPGGIDPAEVAQLLQTEETIKAVVITSPTYEGITSDIQQIAKIVHEHDKILIVDEAHGAHFKFHEKLPRTALEQGADIVIQSFHKTLPAFTQSAVLHVAGSRVDRELLCRHLSMIQTSSPSYILMASMDRCVSMLMDSCSKAYFEQYFAMLHNFRNKFYKNRNVGLLGKEIIGKNFIQDYDIGKLVILLRKELSGYDVERFLENNFKVQVEMSTDTYLLAMTSIADKPEGFQRLYTGLSTVELIMEKLAVRTQEAQAYPKAQYLIHPKKALHYEKAKVKLADAADEISGDYLTPYPPGIPLIAPGEIITEEMLSAIPKKYLDAEISVLTGVNHELFKRLV